MHTRIKICGITHRDDALAAASLGADAIGLIFVDKSPRHVSLAAASVIAKSLPPFVSTVGLFVNSSEVAVREALNIVPLSALQFHGDESPAFCAQFEKPYIKVLRMRENVDVRVFAQQYQSAAAILLDTYQKGAAGGTGQTFDWDLIPRDISLPVILAGGLTPVNVAQAVEKVHPYAVDVSSGVEAEAGKKEIDKLAKFIKEVQRVGTN